METSAGKPRKEALILCGFRNNEFQLDPLDVKVGSVTAIGAVTNTLQLPQQGRAQIYDEPVTFSANCGEADELQRTELTSGSAPIARLKPAEAWL